jgi:hypothetical protein
MQYISEVKGAIQTLTTKRQWKVLRFNANL